MIREQPLTTTKKTEKNRVKAKTSKLKWYTRKFSLKKEESKWEKKRNKDMRHIKDVNSTLAVITLNVNGLNNLVKRQRLAEQN